MKVNLSELKTSSNLLSLFRLLLSIPVFFLLLQLNESYSIRWIIVIILLFASLTDILDGYLARRFNEVTEMGKIIDPLADKVLVGIVILQLFLLEEIPILYFVIVVARDLIIFVGGILISKRIGRVLPSNMLGKITVLTIGIFILTVILQLDIYAKFIYDFFLYVSSLLIFISLIGYAIRAKESLVWYRNESVQKS